jgi:hypothetical protein
MTAAIIALAPLFSGRSCVDSDYAWYSGTSRFKGANPTFLWSRYR